MAMVLNASHGTNQAVSTRAEFEVATSDRMKRGTRKTKVGRNEEDKLPEKPIARLKQIRIPEYKEGEDIDNFLEQFERKMQLRNVDENDYLTYLTNVLSGTAREASSGIDLLKPHIWKSRINCYDNISM